MAIRDFIKENKKALDDHIRKAMGPGHQDAPINNNDRVEWINNDTRLYNWATSCGVKL